MNAGELGRGARTMTSLSSAVVHENNIGVQHELKDPWNWMLQCGPINSPQYIGPTQFLNMCKILFQKQPQ